MDFSPSDDNNLKGKFPRKLGVALGLPRSKDPLFSAHQHYGCVQVYKIYSTGPASRAGMREGDIIIEVGGNPVSKLPDAGSDSVVALIRYIQTQTPGSVLHMLVVREEKEVHLHVEL